jgi:hypothetical protein
MEDADGNFVDQSFKTTSYFVQKCILLLILCCIKTNSLSEDIMVTYDHLYTSGLNAYNDGKWFQCSAFLEKAIEERKFYKRTLVDCRLKCRKILQISDFFIPSDMNSSVESLRLDFFEKLVRESQCLKKCKSENLGPHMHDSRVMPSVDEDFDHLKPYSYLQFCYYKVEYFFFCNSRACFTSEKSWDISSSSSSSKYRIDSKDQVKLSRHGDYKF